MNKEAESKRLYKKHLKECIPTGYVSQKEMEVYRYEAAINAIKELL